jgi:dTDP-4-dehydrorhamnose reductase
MYYGSPMKIQPTTRVYIAGCGGMLGEAVYELFNGRSQVLATDIDVNESWLSPADVRDYAGSAKVVRQFRPDLIINLAALTDLEYCERNPDNAWLTNGLGAENLGLLANELDVPYVYISTAGIFDGAQEFYTDFDPPNPLGVYAKSKAHGEAWTLRSVRKSYVIRAGWMMGGGPRKDKKFVNKLWKQLQAGAKELAVVHDKLGTPTYTVDFARGILGLVESDLFGLYNQVCGGSGSRYDVALAMIEELGLSGSVKVKQVASDHFKTEYFAPRPASEKLLNVKLDARGLNVMRDWRVCLSEYIKRFHLR